MSILRKREDFGGIYPEDNRDAHRQVSPYKPCNLLQRVAAGAQRMGGQRSILAIQRIYERVSTTDPIYSNFEYIHTLAAFLMFPKSFCNDASARS
jgi:hypothetical protein